MVSYYALVLPIENQPSARPYLGLDRPCPASEANSPEAKSVWEEEREALADDDEWCTYHNSLDTALEFRRRYAACGYEFDLIAVYPCECPSDVDYLQQLDGYMGLDITSTEPHSVLHPEGIWRDFPREEGPPELIPIWLLEQKYFRPRLNKWGLLDDFDDAVLLRNLAWALHKIDPTQGDPSGARVLGIVDMKRAGA